MIKKTITYPDYNGIERTNDFYFNITKAEAMEKEMSIDGGLADRIKKIIAADDRPTIVKIFKSIILDSYGEKSADGKRFIKIDENGHHLADDFMQTEAYSQLFMELATDADAAAKFINGILPADLVKEAQKEIPEATVKSV